MKQRVYLISLLFLGLFLFGSINSVSIEYAYSGYICYNCFGTDSWECPVHSGWEVIQMTNPYGGDSDGLCGCPAGLYDSPQLADSHDHTSTYYCTYQKTGIDYKYSGFICYWCFGTDSWECPVHSGWEMIQETNPYGGDNDGECSCPAGLYDLPHTVDIYDHTSTYYCTYQNLDNSSCGDNAHWSEGTCHCNDSWKNYDGDWSNGCEADCYVDTDCGSGESCVGGTCQEEEPVVFVFITTGTVYGTTGISVVYYDPFIGSWNTEIIGISSPGPFCSHPDMSWMAYIVDGELFIRVTKHGFYAENPGGTPINCPGQLYVYHYSKDRVWQGPINICSANSFPGEYSCGYSVKIINNTFHIYSFKPWRTILMGKPCSWPPVSDEHFKHTYYSNGTWIEEDISRDDYPSRGDCGESEQLDPITPHTITETWDPHHIIQDYYPPTNLSHILAEDGDQDQYFSKPGDHAYYWKAFGDKSSGDDIFVIMKDTAGSTRVWIETFEDGTWRPDYNLCSPLSSPCMDAYDLYVLYSGGLEVTSEVTSCNAGGNTLDGFAPGQSVYVKATGLEPNTNYIIWIQDNPVNEGDALSNNEDLSGSQESVTTDENGDFNPILIWNTSLSKPVSYYEYDIVIDKQDDGENTGKYNAASDGIDSASLVGFIIYPEPSTVVLSLIGLFVISGYVKLRERKNN